LLFSLPPERLTNFQLYETVSEGTPVSPIFPSQEALNTWFAMKSKSDAASARLVSSAGTKQVRQPVPGTEKTQGREFMYIESAEGETFHRLVNQAFDARSVARPKAGGTVEEKVRINLKDRVSLIGISYNGDIEGWRAGFVGFCVASGRKYGLIRDRRLLLSDDSSPLLEELEVIFE
jgi:hypothetical protein